MIQFTWVLLFLAISGVNSEAPQTDGNVDISQHPYMVSIRKNHKHICSAVLINEYYIITSDRCVPSVEHSWNIMNVITVVTGKSTIKPENKDTYIKEMFSQNHYINPERRPVTSGVGILKLAMPEKSIRPIELSSMQVPLGEELQMVGWMTNKKEVNSNLSEVTLTTIDREECQELLKNKSRDKKLTDYEFCTLPESSDDSPKGGSGHALIYEGKLVGVSTFGGSDDMPDVHSDAIKMREYLDEVISKSQ